MLGTGTNIDTSVLQLSAGTLRLFRIVRVIAVIPARLASTRLPRKMLRFIAGEPLLAHVYRGVRSSPILEDVIVATDSDEIMSLCREHGWRAVVCAMARRRQYGRQLRGMRALEPGGCARGRGR